MRRRASAPPVRFGSGARAGRRRRVATVPECTAVAGRERRTPDNGAVTASPPSAARPPGEVKSKPEKMGRRDTALRATSVTERRYAPYCG